MATDVRTGDPMGAIGPAPSRPEDHGPRRIGWQLVAASLRDSFVKLDPRVQARNPVMFVVEIGAVIVTLIGSIGLFGRGNDDTSYVLSIAAWLWVTVLFANAAEALAEGRGKAQAAALRRTRAATVARVLVDGARESIEVRASSDLRPGDVVIVEAGETIPGDGEVIEGVAFVSEAAITGESAPVLKEPGTDISSSVTGGTTVVSDHLIIRISSEPGQSFLDRMIALVEGAVRQKSPNEIALDILLAGLTIIFLIVVVTLTPLSIYAGARASTVVSVALLVTLIPTTIGGLLSAIGIAGMDRLMQQNVLAMSGRAVEAAGDVDVLLLDKTGTITFGNRMASDFLPLDGVEVSAMAEAALLASIADTTPEGKSIVLLARQFGANAGEPRDEAEFIPFSAETRMSGIDISGRRILKGAVDAVAQSTGMSSGQLQALANHVAARGGTPLALVDDGQPLGVIALDDTVKPGIRDRFEELRNMGIRTVMVTGDNPLTAATIAAQAGVDDFLAEARPEDKIDLIRRYQAEGRMVAMTGDGTNDAPALAQADVGVAMNTGTAAAKEAGNMVDLDSDPAKLVAIVGIGKQMLMTRGALTTFSIANDVAKYFAIIPALFVLAYPQSGATNLLSPVDVMHLHSPESAILSAIIFNALIIVLLIPLALRGVPYRPMPAAQLLRRNLLVFGVGGLIAPFIGIKTIDFILASMGLV